MNVNNMKVDELGNTLRKFIAESLPTLDLRTLYDIAWLIDPYITDDDGDDFDEDD